MVSAKQKNYQSSIQSVRWFLGMGVFFFAALSLYMDWIYSSWPLIVASIALLFINVFFLSKSSSLSMLSTGLALDGLFIFFFTALTGGAHNPFAMLLLIQVIFAAQCLPLRWTWFFSAYVIFLYSMLFVLDHFSHHTRHHHAHLDAHLLGMLLSFIMICILITYFVAKTSVHINKMEKQAEQDERLILLGAFAAQAAHQLGTPLSSIHLLVDKVRHAPEDKYFSMIKNELQRCKVLIQELADTTEQKKATSGGSYQLDHFVQDSIRIWSERMNFPIKFEIEGSFGCSLVLDKTLQYALFNLFDNAHEAQAQNIAVQLHERPDYFELIIQDDGHGMNQAVIEGRQRGLGLYLTQATVKKLNGYLTLENNPNSGACVKLVIAKKLT